MNYTQQEVLDLLKDHFDYYTESSKDEIWRIKINGKFFYTSKGKTSWSKKHLARSALCNHFTNKAIPILMTIHSKYREQDSERGYWQNNPKAEDVSLLVQQLENAKIVEYIQIQ